MIIKEGNNNHLQDHCNFQYQENDNHNNTFEIEDDDRSIIKNHFEICDKIMEESIQFLLLITLEKEIEMKDNFCHGYKIHEHEEKENVISLNINIDFNDKKEDTYDKDYE